VRGPRTPMLSAYIPIAMFVVVATGFALFTMLFVIFDVETVFMFPWAVIFDKLLLFGLIEMIVFIFILVVGYYYAWQKGALEWV
jgi:NADH-quinone oxidoreductase subunit A